MFHEIMPDDVRCSAKLSVEGEQFRDCCVTVLMRFMIFKIAYSRKIFGFCSAMTINRY